MLAVLADFVTRILANISERAFARHNENLQIKRSMLAKLLELYNSTEVLLSVCESVAKEFREYAEGHETITRVVSSKRLKKLHEEFLDFSKKIRETAAVLEIYDPGISILLRNTESIKSSIWKHIILDEEVLPKMLEKEGKPTFTMRFPTRAPAIGQTDVLDPEIRRENLDLKVADVLRNFERSCEFVEIDIQNREQLESATSEVFKSIEALQEAKEVLREFIAKNFPIAQVFDTTAILRKG